MEKEEKDEYSYVYVEGETFTVEFAFAKKSGSIEFYDKGAKRKNLTHFWAKFMWPTYEQILMWRVAFQKVDRLTKLITVDDVGFDKIKVAHLLESWSFGKEFPEVYPIARTTCGCAMCQQIKKSGLQGVTSALSEESIKIVYLIKTPLVNRMILMMNEVLGI